MLENLRPWEPFSGLPDTTDWPQEWVDEWAWRQLQGHEMVTTLSCVKRISEQQLTLSRLDIIQLALKDCAYMILRDAEADERNYVLGSAQVYAKPLGSAGTGDPMNRYASIAIKGQFHIRMPNMPSNLECFKTEVDVAQARIKRSS